ncbi:hypothetical protein D3Z47_02960 [Lachnospiraceae bacterium]|nr:hypothetical protein [Lachnospiraceae bacterium]
MKNAFRQMYSTLSGRFVPNEGVVAGYVDRIWRKYRAKWGIQMAGMIVQTRSRQNFDGDAVASSRNFNDAMVRQTVPDFIFCPDGVVGCLINLLLQTGC